MEDVHVPVDHVSQQMPTCCEQRVPSAAEALMKRLSEKTAEEVHRAHDIKYDRERPRYRGICANLGNPTFSNTPADPPYFMRPHITFGLNGYQRPIQHPMYTTSSAQLGLQPTPGIVPEKFFPKDVSFTLSCTPGGNYRDTHFTTEMDNDLHS